MIISHKNKYLFVELPRTATTAISNELIKNYDGEKILRKHSTYREFLKNATEEEKNYFVFSGVRNPLERTVSFYVKLKNDHKDQFSNIKMKKNKTLGDRWLIRQFNYIHKNNASFSDYFLKFHKIPYNDKSCLDHDRFNFIYRYENLNEDFEKLITSLNLQFYRPLPQVNKTKKKETNISFYFNNEKVRKKAVSKMGPFMQKWGYEFPSDWEDTNIRKIDFFLFNVYTKLRIIFYKYLK